jgi:transposase
MRCRTPEVFDVDPKRFEDVARRAKAALDPKDAELIEKVFDSYQYLAEVIGEKSMSIGRLQKMLFGAKTEKTDQVVGKTDSSPAASTEQESAKDADEAERNAADEKPPPKGHGRNAANVYQGAERIAVPYGALHAGDPCPECGKGTLYAKRPAVVVRITGQAPLSAKKYELERLRCGLCGKVFTAELPKEAGRQKYDAKAGAMIGLLKYGCGLPFNRMGGLQGNLEIPLPASTQWDVVSSFAPAIHPEFDELIRQAAQGDVVYHDDTTVKILALMGERRQTFGDDPDRKGLFTSGVVATRDGHRIALFFS